MCSWTSRELFRSWFSRDSSFMSFSLSYTHVFRETHTQSPNHCRWTLSIRFQLILWLIGKRHTLETPLIDALLHGLRLIISSSRTISFMWCAHVCHMKFFVFGLYTDFVWSVCLFAHQFKCFPFCMVTCSSPSCTSSPCSCVLTECVCLFAQQVSRSETLMQVTWSLSFDFSVLCSCSAWIHIPDGFTNSLSHSNSWSMHSLSSVCSLSCDTLWVDPLMWDAHVCHMNLLSPKKISVVRDLRAIHTHTRARGKKLFTSPSYVTWGALLCV